MENIDLIKIKKIAITVNSELNNILSIESILFNQSVGQRIDYAGCINELNDSIQNLKKLDLFGSLELRNMNIFVLCLIEYATSLTDMFKKLKSKAEGNWGYSFFAYRSDLKNLRNLEKRRMHLGDIVQNDPIIIKALRAKESD